MKRIGAAIAVLVISVGVAGCGESAPTASSGQDPAVQPASTDATPSVSSQTANVFRLLKARHESTSRAGGLYGSPAEAMPQVRYVVNGRAPISVADAYFVGDFVDVVAGKSFRWSEDSGSEVRHEVPFNSKDAQSSTVHVTFRVLRSIVDPSQKEELQPQFAKGQTVTIGLALGGQINVDAVRAEFKSVGTFAALLYRPSPVFDYDKTLWAVVEDGAFLAKVVNGRAVVFPALDGQKHDQPEQAYSVEADQLEKPSGEPKRFKYDSQNARYEPEGPSK